MEIKPFGNIEFDNLEDYYDANIKVGEQSIELDLNFDIEEEVDNEDLIQIQTFLSDIDSNLDKVFQYIQDDYDLGDESETAREYIEIHQELYGGILTKEEFLSKLKVYRIGFYPQDEEDFIIVDVQFPLELTNYLMAVTLTSDLKLSYIGLDS